MKTWIFQGNPKIFDINRYLSDRTTIWWSFRQTYLQYKIEVGDEVYLWRSDGENKGTGGILAKARIIGPCVQRTDSDAREYWHTDDWQISGTGIPLEVIEVRLTTGFIKRTDLLKHQKLCNLDILKIRNLTNYLLTFEQAQQLDEVWRKANLNSNGNINKFVPIAGSRKLYKQVGTSQYTDGVRIEKEFHIIFNPPGSPFYTERGKARKIEVLFNNKVFDAEYRFENQEDKTTELQSIRFRKELKEEFKKVFPLPEGEFIIEQGQDLNHFIITHAIEVIDIEESDREYPEGQTAFKLHRIRERNREVIKKAKTRFARKHQGRLFCEICGFDFVQTYGERGRDFIEGHHIKMVSEMKEGEKTKVKDIILLCSNCHRMIHRKPLLRPEEMSKLINC